MNCQKNLIQQMFLDVLDDAHLHHLLSDEENL